MMANSNHSSRSGIRINGHRGHPEVRGALVRYARWLRLEFDFPIRVPVYLLRHEHVLTFDGRRVSASFFAPYDRNVEPFIRIATGDYDSLLVEFGGRDNALAAYIVSLSHEVVHYFQWVETGRIWEQGVIVRARGMLRRYERTIDRP